MGKAILPLSGNPPQGRYGGSAGGADSDERQAAHFILDHPQAGEAEAEEALFHQFNALSEAGSSMLILSHMPVARMGWRLPDLASRMRSVNLVRLDPPDDALLRALMEKYFADRQLAVMPAVLDYMVARIERSFAAVQTIAAAMDEIAGAKTVADDEAGPRDHGEFCQR